MHSLNRLSLGPLAFTLLLARPVCAQMQPGAQLPINIPPVNGSAAKLPGGLGGAMRPGTLAAVPPDFAQLKLAPGFLVNLDVLDDTDFQGEFRVDQQGDLALPIIGNVHVAGETASDARLAIQKKLVEGQILKDPQVNLTVVEYAAPEVAIIGEVAAPGRYPLLAPRSLTDVLALAGGVTPAAGNKVVVTHSGADSKPVTVPFSRATDANSVQDTTIQPGDTVQVKRAGIVYVLGAVGKPGGYIMQEDGTMSVLQAISVADGTTLPASVGTIYLMRRNSDGTAIRITLPFDRMQRGKAADMQLQPTDVLYVPTSKLKAALINTQGVLAAATSATIYATAVQ